MNIVKSCGNLIGIATGIAVSITSNEFLTKLIGDVSSYNKFKRVMLKIGISTISGMVSAAGMRYVKDQINDLSNSFSLDASLDDGVVIELNRKGEK